MTPEFLLTIYSSERAIRNIKLKMKISEQFNSLHQEFTIIRSVIDSVIKNGKSVFHTIIKAMVENYRHRKSRWIVTKY